MASQSEGFQPYTKGYDASARRDQDPRGDNGSLTFGGVSKKLWVNEVQTGFGLAGRGVNSYRTRSFFAKNFQQVSLVVSCEFPDQQRYAEVIEFIRHAQVGFGSSTRLEILNRYKGPDVHQNQKGPSQSIVAEGYVKAVTRSHERFVQAPRLSFEFTVERMILPVAWADDGEEKIAHLKSWKDVLGENVLEDRSDDYLGKVINGRAPRKTNDTENLDGNSILMVGDSLTVGTIGPLRALRGRVQADGVVGRSSAATRSKLTSLLRSHHKVVIFDAGTNDDPTTSAAYKNRLESILDSIGARNLVVLTLNRPNVGPMNSVIKSFASENDRVTLVDWNRIAKEEDLLGGDGVHPSAKGYSRRAKLIDSVI